jgi:type IV pilus assembly protein PilQ
LTVNARSIQLAKQLIAQLDVAEPLVELDTEVLEIDEGVQKQLGFKFPTPVLSTTYSELQPAASDSGSGRLLALQPLTRTPLTLGAELDFLVSTNKARILEDPRITTFSGRTASLHAGETVNNLTTTGGGTGTVATTQVQSFQTGVTLDITPVVNADDYITVTLHPSINSEAGISAAGVPNIQTRDTTTTVGLHDGETIVVGGSSRTTIRGRSARCRSSATSRSSDASSKTSASVTRATSWS